MDKYSISQETYFSTFSLLYKSPERVPISKFPKTSKDGELHPLQVRAVEIFYPRQPPCFTGIF
eukprot:TRINITY_DN3686_c0_g1_i1.p2 TRINITY_DN3686_c0_g1~~TRINITY_DN3686_c0_g1_i1.p2  ORF type:complete len:63 (-),score=0.52 TRINITY_DN3686_c0_g1_i1:66-254(-)